MYEYATYKRKFRLMNLRGYDFLKLLDYTSEEIRYLLDASRKFKELKNNGIAHEYLEGKNVVLLFEKDSTRTRCSFEVATKDLGMNCTYLGPTGSQMGKKESIKDTARVLSRMYDGIEYRGFSQEIVEEIARYSDVPVWNGLTDDYHPTQMLADFMTMEEHFGTLKGLQLTFVGDARNNAGNSLMVASAKLGVNFVACGPKELWPNEKLVSECKKIAAENGSFIELTDDINIGVKNSNVIYTDVWVSMGEPDSVWKQRINLLKKYQVTMDVMNQAAENAVFMHALPSFHDLNTTIGKEIYEKYGLDEMEVTDEVFESNRSIVFDEAENRMHTIKAVMYTTLSDNEALWEGKSCEINNYSEIAPLKTILLHRPGNEYLNLTPNTLQRLLFDDIPYLKVAQEEHDRFAEALMAEGVEVVYLVDLVADVLDISKSIRRQFIKQFIKEGGITSKKTYDLVFKYLDNIDDSRELVSKCIEGIDSSELKSLTKRTDFYETRDKGRLILDPLPNLYAPRDPFATIGNGVSLHRMYSVTRCRETIFGEYIFKYHPLYKKTKLYYNRNEFYHIEGGDIQVLSDKVIAIGISERTEPDAIATLARNIFKDSDNSFEVVLAIDIPDERSFMHLDTVMTRVDYKKFAVHSQVMEISTVYEIKNSKNRDINIKKLNMTLDKILEKYLNIDKVELIKCGNGERIAAEREQWSDGVNTLCIKPGVVICYDRNFVTNETLRKHGIRVIEIPSCELSRGRGGPHCMSMALCRREENEIKK